jgi:hypothetical protein
MYRDNVTFLSQQKGSRLESTVRRQPDIVGMNYYFERIGATAAVQKVGRAQPTPNISTPHSRRRVSMATYNWGDTVDNDDKLKVLINPESDSSSLALSALRKQGRMARPQFLSPTLRSLATPRSTMTQLCSQEQMTVAAGQFSVSEKLS